ncbi:MAG: OB-fold domain-containing protein [Sphingopyxis sp.]|nr:OB-fold domain-containing protein [Sphingopyxis sp.]
MTHEPGSIVAVGGYLPLLRLDRAQAAKSLRHFGLGGRQAGYRTVAGWDEDAFTLAAEASRAIVESPPARVCFASTSAPFIDRAHASLLVDALALPRSTRTLDVAGSRRCAVAALLDALLGADDALIAAGERRPAKAGSPSHLAYGDGGSAARTGTEGAAKLVGWASEAHDLLDSYASRGHETAYASEERFVRDIASSAIIAPAIAGACARAGIAPGDIKWAAVHEPLSGMWKDIARRTGITAPNHAATLAEQAGDLGAAHALFALALAFEAACPGDHVLLAGFGSGCDALIFRVDAKVPGAAEARAALGLGEASADYVRFLSLSGALDLDFGVRSEFEQKAQATVLERYGRDTLGFIGGRDAKGNVQFPKTPIPVRPGAEDREALEDVRLADLAATVASVTADRLNYTPDPPFWFGLVQFDNGARILMELTDAGPAGFKVGDPLGMRLRIKAVDKRRGMRTYFWKGAPAKRPQMEA